MSWDDEYDRDLPQECDLDDGSADLAEMACPSCGGAVVEDTQKCPHCDDWITPVDPPRDQWKRWLLAVAVLVMLYAMFRFVFR